MTMKAPNDEAAPRHTTAILAIILISYFMILLDNSIIFTALPTIHTAMHYSTTGLAWVQDAYTLVFGGLLLLGARAGDLLGRRRVFIFGVAAFAFASLLVGVAPAGLAFAPMTSAGIAGVGADDAGAASGMVNTFHQVGVALGLGVLIAVSAHAGHDLTAPAAVLTAHVNTALTAGSALLALCLIATLALILPAELAGRHRDTRRSGLPTPPERVLAAATRD